MSWLTDQLPDFSDPQQMALFGALGGLARSAAPQYGPTGKGVTGMGAGTGLMGILSNVLGGTVAGAQGAQGYQKEQLANQQAQQINPLQVQAQQMSNQLGQLGLEKAQALQPMQLDMIKSMLGGGQNSMPGSLAGGITAPKDYKVTPVDALFGRARQEAMVAAATSGNFEPLSKVDLSWAEHSPELANAIKAAETQATPQKTAQDTYQFMQPPPYQSNFGSMAPHITSAAIQGITGNRDMAPQGPGAQEQHETPEGVQPPIVPVQGPQQLPPPMPGNQPMPQAQPAQIPQVNASQLEPPPIAPMQQGANKTQYPSLAKGTDGTPLMAGDGKPILSSLTNKPFYKANPNGQPKFPTDLPSNATNTQVHAMNQQNDKNIADMAEGNKSFGELASTLANEKTQLNQLTSLFQETKTGTATAIWPQLLQHAIALGVPIDASKVHSLADYQAMLGIGTKQVLSDLKNNSVSADGGTPMRIFGSEVSASIENAINPKLQPEALFKMVGNVSGQVDRGLDMINSWQHVGGRANTIDNGNSQLPADFTQKFFSEHPADNYIKKWEEKTTPFKGMSGNSEAGSAAPKINWKRVDGKLVKE